METERFLPQGDADAADLTKGNTVAANLCTSKHVMMARCYEIVIAFSSHFDGPLAKGLARRMIEL